MPVTPGRELPIIREMNFADYAQVSELETAHKLGGISYQEWRHLWTDNPARRAVGHWPIGWVLESAADGIVGSIGNVPIWYELDGRPLIAATGRCWVVRPEFRGLAVALLDRVVNQPGIDFFVNTTVTDVASAAINGLQCVRVTAGRWDHSAFWITGHAAFARTVLRGPSFPLGALWHPLSLGLRLLERLRGCASIGPSDYGIEVQSCFDERFDGFWEALRRIHRNTLLAKRSRECLNWHFRYALLQRRAWVVAAMRKGRLVAYAVFDRRDNLYTGLRRMRLVDFQSLDDDGPLVALLHWALDTCRRDGVCVLEDIGCSLEHRFGKKLAPYRRRLPCWNFYYKANDPSLNQRLRSPEAWNASTFDGDASL